jgi:hypothetical protein
MTKRQRRKRCPYCGELFWPDRRTAWRQWACGKASCQAKRRAETQRRYRRNNAGDQAARRYREAIAAAKDGAFGLHSIPGEGSVFRSLVWEEIKDEIAPQLSVTLVFFARLLIAALRDERVMQPAVIHQEIGKYGIDAEKDETDGICPSG